MSGPATARDFKLSQLAPKKRSVRRPLVIASAVLFLVSSCAAEWSRYDALYATAALAALAIAVTALVAKRAKPDPGDLWPIWRRTLHSWTSRIAAALLLATLAGECLARTASLHRALLYERRGDLLFTPVPDQIYSEKLSGSRSRINRIGLRGPDVRLDPAAKTVMCLGDSVTYGYALHDSETYPSRLQANLDAVAQGRYQVLNAGVNAYPMALMRQKFLRLWADGIRPDVAVIGYSMNEGSILSKVIDSDAQTKATFERRLLLKNRLRSFGLYNLVVENWARAYYDRLKSKMIPGTHTTDLTIEEFESQYEGTLAGLNADLQARGVQPIFLLFCSWDAKQNRFASDGPLQKRFARFASQRNIPLFRSEDALKAGLRADESLDQFFIDPVHMNERGTAKFAQAFAKFLGTAAALPGQ